MRKIGILGGTFNPIHNGHLHIAQGFQKHLELDSMILIPSRKPTHKTADNLESGQDRLAMCRIAAREYGYQVSDIEIRRETASYTVYTLETLREWYPDDRFYLLMGEDMFLTLLQWKNINRICELAILCAAPRSGNAAERLMRYGERLHEIGGVVRIVPVEYQDLSSTQIRNRIRRGDSVSGLMPDGVAEYIREHQLYQGGSHDER